MALRKEWWRRLRYLFQRSRFESDLRDEMQFHVECRAAELVQAGASQEEALVRARREFGSRVRITEHTHDVWQLRWLEDLFFDVRYAARAMRRNPTFAITAVFCLALGIGANTTIFSITTGFLFSQPSCRDSASVIAIWEGGNSSSSITDYKFIRDAHVFEGMGGMNPEREVNWRDGDRTSRLFAGLVTDDYFDVLGIPLLLGRGIAPGETDTAVLSYRLWRGRFAADSDVLGRKIVLDGRLHTVVGVLPADHRTVVGFGFSPEIYVPSTQETDAVQFYARMPPGMNQATASAQLRVVFEELDRIHPKDGWKRTTQVRITGVTGIQVLGQQMMGPVLAFFGMLMIVVSLVLLIACTNVASLLLSRAASRTQELAIRLSLGASRTRIVRHLLAESLLLAALGAIAGLAITVFCGQLLSKVRLPLPIPIQLVLTPDWRLLVYCLTVAMGSALVSGLMPALKAVRRDVNNALKSNERQTERSTLRSALVGGQVAVTLVLLATGLLFIHNLLRATSMSPGFDTRHTAWAYMRLVPEKYKDPARATALVEEALDRLRALPGVEAAAITRRVPLNDNCMMGVEVSTDLSQTPVAVRYQCNNVGPDYFRAIGIPLLRGREFSNGDGKGSQPVAIVNESFARGVFGEKDPVGRTIAVFKERPMLVVGLVKDSKYFTLGEAQRMAVYEPYFAHDEPVNLNFIVRTYGSPSGSVKPVSDALDRLDASAAIETKPMIQSLGLALLPSQAGAALLGAMGLLSLGLAAIGLYGVILYSVSRRIREIGIRVALGATPAEVLRVVCGHSFAVAGVGMAIGLGLALLATRPLAMFLVPGLSASDPAAYLAVIGILAGVTVLAALGPAIRALRLDPMTALRYE
jgi:predicted permease